VIVDLGGDDRYRGSDLVVHGLSAIIDFSGDDRYTMIGPGLGAAIAGTSIIVDFTGDDFYEAGLFGQGAAAFGLAQSWICVATTPIACAPVGRALA